jgi:hypothetical protein
MLNLAGLSPEYRKGLKAGKRRHHPCQRDFVTAEFQYLGKSIACLREDFSAQYETRRREPISAEQAAQPRTSIESLNVHGLNGEAQSEFRNDRGILRSDV